MMFLLALLASAVYGVDNTGTRHMLLNMPMQDGSQLEMCAETNWNFGGCSTAQKELYYNSLFASQQAGGCPSEYGATMNKNVDNDITCTNDSGGLVTNAKFSTITKMKNACIAQSDSGMNMVMKFECSSGYKKILSWMGKSSTSDCVGTPSMTQYEKLETCKMKDGKLREYVCDGNAEKEQPCSAADASFTPDKYKLVKTDSCMKFVNGYYAKQTCKGTTKVNHNQMLYGDAECTNLFMTERKTKEGCIDQDHLECYNGYTKEVECSTSDGVETTDNVDMVVNKCNVNPDDQDKFLKVLTCGAEEATLSVYNKKSDDPLGSCVDSQKVSPGGDVTLKVKGGCKNNALGMYLQAWCVDGALRVKKCEQSEYDANAADVPEAQSNQTPESGDSGSLPSVPGGLPSSASTVSVALMTFLMLFY